eukprot:153563-Hanusia_phi.AAC.3
MREEGVRAISALLQDGCLTRILSIHEQGNFATVARAMALASCLCSQPSPPPHLRQTSSVHLIADAMAATSSHMQGEETNE